MATYLLDTNHASPLVTLHHPLRRRVLAELAAGNIFTICIPVLAETLFGIGIVPRASQNRVVWAQLQSQLHCYGIEAADVELAVDLQISLRQRGRQLATLDALIAVTALRYDLTLLTIDGDFRVVPRLRFESWL
ncbi:MAG: type II toxin-antitoxin system VapC family toxin [Roseiflexaceae bacterium]